MKLRPLHDRVVVERSEAEQTSAAGIVIPDTAKDKPIQGKVISIGPGKRLDNGQLSPVGLKEGDKVLFGKYSGTEVKLNGTEYLVMREDDIMAVVEG